MNVEIVAHIMDAAAFILVTPEFLDEKTLLRWKCRLMEIN